jgi:hypothetical protein
VLAVITPDAAEDAGRAEDAEGAEGGEGAR